MVTILAIDPGIQIKICKAEDCNDNSEALGFCDKHYRKFKKYGDPLFTINESHGLNKSSEYRTWADMLQRCTNLKDTGYHRYGGRGITVCDRWKNSFTFFYEDMGPKPFPKAQIDRKKNNKGYYKSNCRWVTRVQNAQNTRRNSFTKEIVKQVRHMYEKEGFTAGQLQRIFNVPSSTLSYVLHYKTWRNVI